MWRELRDEMHPHGLELVTVGLDTLGSEGCRAFIEAAQPTHPALIDRHHRLADLFGVTNIPSSIWIDEEGVLVRVVDDTSGWRWERLAYLAEPFEPGDPTG